MPDGDEGLFIRLMGELKLTLNGLKDEFQAQRDERKRIQALASQSEVTRFVRLHGKVTLDANGFGVIAFNPGGPDQGYTWNVRNLAVGGATVTTAVAGRADVFVSAADYRYFDSLAEFGLQDWRDQATALPLVGPYGDGELFIQFQEKLYVVVSGGTAGQTVIAVGTAKQVQESTALKVSAN